jgi:hypothetical protein
MAESALAPASGGTDRPVAAPNAVPWYVWCSVFAVTSTIIGGHWDIAWHRSIGRDNFWTPAHIAIYLGGVLSGLYCAWLILSTTFRSSQEARDNSVTMWGFRGPLGAFIAAWGGLTMITSAPFDDWWHNAYGLDVKVLSPPHVVLIAGIVAMELGSLILILGAMNRANGALRRRLERLFLYVGAMIVTLLMILVIEYILRTYMHSGLFYRVVCTAIPIVLAAVARATRHRWASTIVISIYSLLLAGMVWIFPLFPAEPKLGPVYQNVRHFIPPEFPLLLIVPALLLDIVWARLGHRGKWLQAFVAGLVFLVSFIAVQWPFADFLMSNSARNAFFGTTYFDYNLHPNSNYARYRFAQLEKTTMEFWRQMGLALVLAILTTRLGLGWGDWMRGIKR